VELKARYFVAAAVTTVMCVMTDGYILESALSADTTVVSIPSQMGHTTEAVILLDGAQSSGSLRGKAILPAIQQDGRNVDVHLIDYNQSHFVAKEVITTVLNIAKRYKRVTLIGLSMGGLLSADIVLEAEKQRLTVELQMILVCAPSGGDDLQDERSSVFGWLPVGPIISAAMTDLFWSISFRPPNLDSIQAGPDTTTLQKNWDVARHYPLNGWAGQVRYIVNHTAFAAGSLAHVHVVYLSCMNDNIVKPSAYDEWSKMAGGLLPHMTVDSPHVALLEFPEKWQSAIKWAFSVLPK